MSDVKPLVQGIDGELQQVQQQDQIDPTTLPQDRETNLRRLFRVLVMDLMRMGFPLSQELIAEASKQG